MTEEWKGISGLPDYEVSNLGNIRSWKPYRNFAPVPKAPRLMKVSRDKDGYRKVGLYGDGTIRYFRVATIVASEWIGPRPDGCVVRHLDGSRTNDCVLNLAWGTPAENSADSKQHGTWVHGRRVNTVKLREQDVIDVLTSSDGHSSLARKYGVTPGAIWHIRAGRSWKHITRMEGKQ